MITPMVFEYWWPRVEFLFRSNQFIPLKVEATLGATRLRQHFQIVATSGATQLDVKFGPVGGCIANADIFHQDLVTKDERRMVMLFQAGWVATAIATVLITIRRVSFSRSPASGSG
jgi:hypothetical protein